MRAAWVWALLFAPGATFELQGADEPVARKPAPKSGAEKKSAKPATEKAAPKPAEKETAKKAAPKSDAKPKADLASPGTKVSLAFSVPLQRKLLVRRTARMEGTGKMSGGPLPKPIQSPLKIEDELQFIDEQIPSVADRGQGMRKVLKYRGQTNGEATDSPYAGVEILYTTAGDGRELEVKSDHQFSQEGLNDLLRLGRSFGLWLALPKDAIVGRKYEIDATPLAPLLTSGDIPPTLAKASCTFESFDKTTGIATLRGSIELAEKGEKEGKSLSAKYHGDLLILMSPGESRIVSLNVQGACEMTAEQKASPIRIEGAGKLTIDLASEIGESVSRASGSKVAPRDRVQTLDDLGLKLRLPGHYQRVYLNGATQFLRTPDRSKGEAVVLISYIREKAPNAKAFFDGIQVTLKKLDPNVKTEKVRCSFGEGKSFVLETGEKGARQRIRSEIYPVSDGVWLMYKLAADPRHFSLADKEFTKARGTLSKLQ